MTAAIINAIEYHLPERRLSNENLGEEFPDWSVEKISAKTGIDARRIASADECSSDLAVLAANKLFSQGIDRSNCLLYTSPSPRDATLSRMPSSA